MVERSVGTPPPVRTREKRLDAWKEIAAYLGRDVTTVQRWEKREGMPVHRHLHNSRGSVYALSSELDAWLEGRRLRLEASDETTAPATAPPAQQQNEDQGGASPAWKMALWLPLALILTLALVVAGWLSYRVHPQSSSQPGIHSLAVLPLRNLSGDPAKEYLADGMTEALIGRLTEIRDLRVHSYTSVIRFRTSQLSVPEIARMLNVDAVVEGSVTQVGGRIRVTAQLIRGSTDEHFWSETYDREMRDALTLESELAQAIAEKVNATVTGEERRRLISTRTISPEVYENYLKGRFSLSRSNSSAEIRQSITDFAQALDKDATFAPAYLGLAKAYTILGTVFAGGSPAETRPKVMEFARKAIAFDPGLVEAHVVLANVLQEEWHWTEAETEYRRALELNPNSAHAHAGFALWLSCKGRPAEAVEEIKRGRQLDPVEVSGGSVSWILFHAHHFDEAIHESRSALAVQPDDANTLLGLGFSLIANNQAAEAIPALEKARALSEGSPAATGVLIRAYAHAGRRKDGLLLLEQLKARKNAGYVPAAAFVNAYLGLGDDAQAFHWLEQAYQEKSNILQFLLTHPYFDPVRSSPQFADLVRRVGLR